MCPGGSVANAIGLWVPLRQRSQATCQNKSSNDQVPSGAFERFDEMTPTLAAGMYASRNRVRGLQLFGGSRRCRPTALARALSHAQKITLREYCL
jgi:hypothetical protein